MGKRLSQLGQAEQVKKEDYLLVDGQNYLESKKIPFEDINLSNFNTDGFYNQNTVDSLLEQKQNSLVSGKTIKTINGLNLLGEGNIIIATDADQTYTPDSENAQSGKAVAEAVENKYEKPITGIPKIDLASDVQSSLEKSNEQYFDITPQGMVSLKAEYRGKGIADYSYSVSDRGADNNGSRNNLLPDNLVIPNSINNINVSSLSSGMFYGNYAIEKVTLPSGITIIPEYCFASAENLVELLDTNSITTVQTFGLYLTGLKELSLQSLTTVGIRALAYNFKLESIDIGNLATLSEGCFENDSLLVTIYGGTSITVIPKYCFVNTINLRNLSFINNVTNVGDYAFKLSGLVANWDAIAQNPCTFGTWATSKQRHSTDFYSDVTVNKTVINKIPIILNQQYSGWKDKYISPNNIDETKRTKSFGEGCAFFSPMMAYCGLNNSFDFKDATDFQAEANSIIVDDGENQYTALQYYTSSASGIETFVSKLGLTATKYDDFTAENTQILYNTIQNGGYALIWRPTGDPKSSEGHIVVAYGIDMKSKRLYIADSMLITSLGRYYDENDVRHAIFTGINRLGRMDGFTYQINIENLVQSGNDNHSGYFIAVTKNNGEYQNVTKGYVDMMIGDIETALTTLTTGGGAE